VQDFPVGDSDPSSRLRTIGRDYETLKTSLLSQVGYFICLLHGFNFNFVGRWLNSYKYAPIMATYFPITDGMGTEDWTLDGCGVTDVSFCVRFHQGDAGSYTNKTSLHCKLEYSAKDIFIKLCFCLLPGVTFCISSFGGNLRIVPIANAALLTQEDVDLLSELIDDEASKIIAANSTLMDYNVNAVVHENKEPDNKDNESSMTLLSVSESQTDVSTVRTRRRLSFAD
jgi:hypothetical protein